MKWILFLILALSPSFAYAESEGTPADESVTTTVESQSMQGLPEPQIDADSVKPAEKQDPVPLKQGEKDESANVRFQSIDDLNKIGR